MAVMRSQTKLQYMVKPQMIRDEKYDKVEVMESQIKYLSTKTMVSLHLLNFTMAVFVVDKTVPYSVNVLDVLDVLNTRSSQEAFIRDFLEF